MAAGPELFAALHGQRASGPRHGATYTKSLKLKFLAQRLHIPAALLLIELPGWREPLLFCLLADRETSVSGPLSFDKVPSEGFF